MLSTLFSQILPTIDPKLLQAIALVESDGDGWENGRPKIRFENHLFLEACEAANSYFSVGSPSWTEHKVWLAGVWTDVHESQANEYQALTIAKELCFAQAYESISIGTFQLHTVNYRLIGFRSAFLMYAFMSESPERELEVLQVFIRKNRTLEQAMLNHDFHAIAQVWNSGSPTWEQEFRLAYANLTSGEKP